MVAHSRTDRISICALQVLADAGPEGLTLQEMARRMQRNGLRDMARSSRTPEASLGGVLARDAVFFKTAPATFALQAVVAFHRQYVFTMLQQRNSVGGYGRLRP